MQWSNTISASLLLAMSVARAADVPTAFVSSQTSYPHIFSVPKTIETTKTTTRWPAERRQNMIHISRRNSPTPLRMSDEAEEEEEWHPRDPAKTTPQLLASIWNLIGRGKDMVRGESFTAIFPEMISLLNNPSYLQRLMGHLDTCKDVCDDFGVNTILIPFKERRQITGFTVKSYRNPNRLNQDGEYQFDPDPFWDDDEEWDFSGLDDDDGEDVKTELSDLPDIEDPIPQDDEKITDITRNWVSKMMADLALCPFTASADRSGVPMGPVFYHIDRGTNIERMYESYWKEVIRVEQNEEKDLSTTLLIMPEFLLDSVELFENWCNTLTQPLEALKVEDLLQIIFFHPQWTFRDGGERSGMGSAANYARRSPWPMINLIRTNQVRAAQKGIPTGLVYTQNEKTLSGIGSKNLEKMLRLRDWEDIKDVKVDRRDMEALRVAQDLQATGVVSAEDQSMIGDSTPAANKVDKDQVDGGDMINVIIQALGKRLEGGEGGSVQRLSGTETSAAMMASDFLLAELDRIVASSPPPAETTSAASSAVKEDGGKTLTEDQKRAYQKAMEDDWASASNQNEEDEMSAMFGGGGIMGGNNEDDEERSNNDPAFFY
mmetsp:Transcript_11287/g.15632  ORF Transcript_11287/g.15632 Transcript_11287/m.15632 type:complete len:603 (-) Transcript_11287:299-2107(-)